ncbi:MAG: sugar phosphate isomerase/epimerase [Lentisphaerae bacterium]|nr:sugar phosphate isomerase/epimerase [Lentisphaerota bacterium]
MTDSFTVSHYYQWGYISDKHLPSVFAEFADNGTKHLVAVSEWCLSIMGQIGFQQKLTDLLANHGLTLREAHAPRGEFWDLNVKDSDRRNYMIAGHQLIMKRLSDMGVRTYTIHVGALPCYFNGGIYTDDLRELSLRTLESLLPVAEKHDIIIAVENAYEPANTPEEVLACVEPFNSPYIGCCFDAGHANIMSATQERTLADIKEYIRENAWCGNMELHPNAFEVMAPWIVTCHLHDNNALADQHTIPGSGNVNWQELMDGLKECPRLIGIQSECTTVNQGVSITKLCRTFDDLIKM